MSRNAPEQKPAAGMLRLSRFSFSLLATTALLVPYILLLLRLDLSPLPDVDYWYMSLQIWHPDGTLDLPGLFQVWNQHFMVLGKALFVLNTWLTGGSNYGLVAFAVTFSFLCAVILSIAFARAVPAGFDLVRLSGIFAVATGMTPVIGSHLFQMGMSGTQWFLANLLAILALAIQNHAWTRPGRAHALGICLAGFLALLACLSYGTGYAVLPALLFLTVLARRPRQELLLLLPWLILSFGLFVYAQARPLTEVGIARDLAEQGDDWPALLKAVLVPASLTGGLFTGKFWLAVTIGLPTFLLFAVFLYFLIKNNKEISHPTWFFFGVAVFGGGAILVISLARFERAIEFTMTQSRYYSLPALFLVGLVLGGVLLLLQYRERFPARGIALVGLALPLVPAVGILSRAPLDWTLLTLRKERGSIYLRLGEVPPELGIFPQKGQGFEELFQALYNLQHYPFNNNHPLHTWLGRTVPERNGVLPLVEFFVDPISAESLEVRGILHQPAGETLQYVLLTDQNGTVIGAAQPGFEIILQRDAPRENTVSFQGLIRPKPGELQDILVYGLLEGHRGVFRIAERPDPDPPRAHPHDGSP